MRLQLPDPTLGLSRQTSEDILEVPYVFRLPAGRPYAAISC